MGILPPFFLNFEFGIFVIRTGASTARAPRHPSSPAHTQIEAKGVFKEGGGGEPGGRNEEAARVARTNPELLVRVWHAFCAITRCVCRVLLPGMPALKLMRPTD